MTPGLAIVGARDEDETRSVSLPRSRFLQALPVELLARMEPDLEAITLERDEVLIQPGLALDFVYFPTSCMISVIVKLEDGNAIESTTIGNDGFSGIAAFLGNEVGDLTNMVQIPGEAMRMRVDAFRALLDDPGLRTHLGGYAARMFAAMGQSAACISFHAFHERLARWLLLVQDDIERGEFPLTQEFMAMMLGVHRPTVTIAIGMLQNAGLIEHRRGVIKITDRAGLIAAACECYPAKADLLD